MPELNEILRLLNSWFVNASCVQGSVPYLFLAYTHQLQYPFFIYYGDSPNPNQETLNGLMRELRQAANRDEDSQYPLIMIHPRNHIYMVGVMMFWDFNRLYNNNNINWQQLRPNTISWLEMQIGARRMHINSVPMEYVGVFKTITLNTGDLIEAQIKYWRKFTESYKMTPYQPKDEQERFNRLLNGTPENEYPSDMLDEQILQQVRSIYPEAEMKSKILLFDTDLLNIRMLKDKLFRSLNFRTCFQDLNAANPVYEEFQLELECYYYPNFIKQSHFKQLGQCTLITLKEFKEIKQLYNTTYQPISYFNI